MRDHGSIAAAGLYPAVPNEEEAMKAENDAGTTKNVASNLETEDSSRSAGSGMEAQEVHREAVSFYRRGLPGSPGPKHSELLERCGSV